MQGDGVVATGLVVGLLVLASWGLAGSARSAPALSSELRAFDSHIDHIVFLMQENHAFDNLFGTYCPAVGKYCKMAAAGIPNGTCIPKNPYNPGPRCIVPFDFTAKNLSLAADLPHEWTSSHKAWNNGSMNEFYFAEDKRLDPFGHYNGTTAPVYWDLAEQYGLADDFYSSSLSYSLPNHWYEVANAAPTASYKGQLASEKPSQKHVYLNQANVTPTIEDQLVNSSISWAWYNYALPNYSKAIQSPPNTVPGPAYGYWDPLAGRNETYVPSTLSHFVARSQFFQDAANGTLPNLSWIIPSAVNSDHPPMNLTAGESWIAQIVDALELSPEWNSTVLFISWDEYGGFWDPVPPPVTSGWGDGFRVPLLAIGPWVREGVIDHAPMDFSSILHLMEARYNLPCLGPTVCNATLPLVMFNYSKGPRAPIQIFPYGKARYPMSLQSWGKLPAYGTQQGAAPVAYRDPPLPAVPPGPGVDWT